VNSAYNVGVPQLRRLQEEMIRAARILEQGEEHWRDIFTNNDFFLRHSNFLQVTVRAKNTIDFLPWQRFCESRLRLLIVALETPQVSPWPFARFFGQQFTKFGKVRDSNQKTDETCMQENHFFIALRFAPGVKSIDLRYFISDFLHKMNSWEERKEGMDLGICRVLQEDLPTFVFDRPLINKVHSVANEEKPKLPQPNSTTPQGAAKGGGTKLTPKMGRSTLSDEDIGHESPAKRARGQGGSFKE
jgi:poly(A) polymerase Pap1